MCRQSTNGLEPSNPDAEALRERLSEVEGFEQALSDEGIEVEQVLGAAIEENELVVYVLPEGETWGNGAHRWPEPSGDAQRGTGQTGRQLRSIPAC